MRPSMRQTAVTEVMTAWMTASEDIPLIIVSLYTHNYQSGPRSGDSVGFWWGLGLRTMVGAIDRDRVERSASGDRGRTI